MSLWLWYIGANACVGCDVISRRHHVRAIAGTTHAVDVYSGGRGISSYRRLTFSCWLHRSADARLTTVVRVTDRLAEWSDQRLKRLRPGFNSRTDTLVVDSSFHRFGIDNWAPAAGGVGVWRVMCRAASGAVATRSCIILLPNVHILVIKSGLALIALRLNRYINHRAF